MSDELTKDIDNASNSLSKMERILQKITESAAKFSTTLSSGLRNSTQGNNGGIGQTGIGSSGNSMMNGSLANVPGFLSMNRTMNLGYAAAQGGIRAATSIVSGGFAAMPDVASTMARSQGFYNASLMGGGGGYANVMNRTMRFMNGGITSQGGIPVGDVQTANILASSGVGVNTAQFGTLATSVKNAAKYLNVDNQVAAQSMAGLTQGPMSSNLMRNFGIYTTDPRTGRRLSPSEIYSAVANRITGGQKLTAKEIMTSKQGGALAFDLSQIGDQTTQDMVYQTMLANASDAKTNGLNISSNASMKAFAKANGLNPNDSQLQINSMEAGTMNTASGNYIKGMQDAVGVLKQFHDVMNNFLKSPFGQQMARLNGAANGVMSDSVAGGVMGGIAGAFGGLGQIGGALLTNSMLSRTLARAGLGGAAGKGGKGMVWKPGGKGGGGKWVKAPKAGKAGGKLGGKLVRGAGGALGGDVVSGVASGLGANADQSYWAGLAGSFGVGELIGGAETFGVSGLISAGIYAATNFGGTMQAFGDLFSGKGTGGTTSTVGSSPMSDTSGTLKLIHPVGRARVTCRYGQKDSLHGSGHNGVDFGVDTGTVVLAAADGTITRAGGSAANTMGTSDHSFGICIEIKHAGGYTTLYGHLSSVGVKVGDTVKQGQKIGLSGNTGYSTGPHLHFELRKNGSPIDPSAALGANYTAGFGSYSAIDGASDYAASDSSNSSGASVDGGGGAGLLGYSVSAAGGLHVPPSYSGAGGSGIGSATSSGDSNGGGMIGHGATAAAPSGASIGATVGGGSPGGGNSVVINLSIAQASDTEARRFANMVKQYLEEDNMMSSMGRM